MSSQRQDSIDRDSLFGDNYSETHDETALPATNDAEQSMNNKPGADLNTSMGNNDQDGRLAGSAQPTYNRPSRDDFFSEDISMFDNSMPAQSHGASEQLLSSSTNIAAEDNAVFAPGNHDIPDLEPNDLFDNWQADDQLPDNFSDFVENVDFPDNTNSTNMPGTIVQQAPIANSAQTALGPSRHGLTIPANARRPRLLTDDELQQIEGLLPRMSVTWEKCLDRCRQAEFSPMAVRILPEKYEEHKATMRQLHDELQEAVRNRLGITNPCTQVNVDRAGHFIDGIFTKARKCFETTSARFITFRAPVELWQLDQYNYLIAIQWAAEGIIRGRPGLHDEANAIGVTQLTTMKWQQEITRKWIEKLKGDTPRAGGNDDVDDDGNDDDDNDNDDHDGDNGNGGEQPRLNRFRKPAPPTYDSSEAEESGPKGRPGRPPGARNKTPAERAAAKAAKTTRRRRRPAKKPATQPEATATAAVAALSSSAPARVQPPQAAPLRMAYNPMTGYDLPVNGPWRDHHQPPRGIPQPSSMDLQQREPSIIGLPRTQFEAHLQQQQSARMLVGIGIAQGPQATQQQAIHPSQMSPMRSTPQRVVSTPARPADIFASSSPLVKSSPRVKTPPSGKVERTYFR